MPENKNVAPSAEVFESETSVWWDLNSCPVPDGYDASRVGPCIKSALEKLGYSGPLTIFGFGNLKDTPEHVLQGLSSSGIPLRNVPSTDYLSLVTAMLVWEAKHRRALVTIMVITDSVGVDVCSPALIPLYQERQRTILLAYPENREGTYAFATHKEWLWKPLLEDAKLNTTGDFTCKLCTLYYNRLEDFTRHLKGERHAVNEAGYYPRILTVEQEATTSISKKKSRDETMTEELPTTRKQPERMAKKRRTTYELLPKHDNKKAHLSSLRKHNLVS